MSLDLEVQAPDFAGNVIDKPQYLAVNASPSMKAELDDTPAKDNNLKVDADGDGAFEEQKAPDVSEPLTVDFTPPSQISNLSVTEATSGTATLAWSKQRVYWASWTDYQNRQLSHQGRLMVSSTASAALLAR